MIDALPTTPSFRLDGKRALVTGASLGIGRAAAAALAGAGAHTVLIARTGANLDAACDQIVAAGGSCESRTLDVTDQAAFETFTKAFPGRRIVQVDITDIAWAGGGIHCMTQQQPA